MRAALIVRFAIFLILAAVPLLHANAYWIHVFVLVLIAAILSFSEQLLVGMAGIVSLGQGAFYGIGAYAAATLSGSFKLPFLPAIIVGGLLAGLSSLLLIPIVRLKGSSLAVATLGFAIIVHLVMLNEDWLTGGSIGMMDIPTPALFGVSLGGDVAFYYVALIMAAAVFLTFDRITHSRFGRALIAMSQDEEAARASGVAIAVYKSKCFLIAAIASGIAGGLYAFHSRYLNPNDFGFQKSIDILIMVVVGGIRSLPGAALGAAIVVLIPEVLRTSGEFRLILFGVLVIVLAGAGNGGLAGIATDIARRISLRWRRRASQTPSIARP